MVACNDCTQVANDTAGNATFRRILWVALLANIAMFAVELVASLLGDSVALLADALDFFGDAANYAISLAVVGAGLATRAVAGLIKGATMAAFGLWVIGSAVWRALTGSMPEPLIMSSVAALALAVNTGVAVMLYRYRRGDSNMRSIWLCSRNDVIGNVAVLLAAGGVFASGTRWPDLAVATVIAALHLSAATQVIRLARTELRAKPDHRP